MNTKSKKEKEFWKRRDRENKIYNSNRLFFSGGFLVVFFTYQYVKLCLTFSSYEEFKVAVRSTEKGSSLSFLVEIAIGLLLIWFGIKIRKSPISDGPRDLP